MANKLEDDDIVATLNAGVRQSVGFGDSKMSREREKVLRYREGEYPRRVSDKDSSFVSMDVYEGQESMKAQLLEAISGGKRPVTFTPAQGETADAAAVRTDYINDVLFDQNPGFQVLQTTIDDGLSSRTSVVKVWWETKVDEVEFDLADPVLDEIGQFLEDNKGSSIKEVEHYDVDNGETGEGHAKRVRFTTVKDRSQVRIAVVPPEEFGISPRATCIEEAEICFHRQRKSASDLRELGFDQDVIEDLQSNDRLWLDMEPEVLARFAQTDDLVSSNSLENGAGKKTCLLYEVYADLDVEGEGVTDLWKVMMVGDTLLHKEKVDRRPFVPFTPLPRPHTFWGANYGLQLVPIQNARTYLTRSIINHALTTNNPRLQVLKGGVVNPRELLENRHGGIVNITRLDAITPIPQAGLNSFVFQTIEMLKGTKEEITGISGLSQGLDKDAISTQNGGAMVHELITVSQTRQKIIARNFCENFLRGLYTMAYLLVCENEDREKIVRIAGTWAPVDFTKWPSDSRMAVGFALGYGETEKEVQKWSGLHSYLSSDKSMANHYGEAQKYAVITQVVKAMGIRDVDSYFLPMDKVQPLPPDPMMLADIDAKKADAEVKRANAQAAIQAVQVKDKAHTLKAQIDVGKLQHTVSIDAAELELQRQIVANAPTAEARAIVNTAG